MAYIRTIDFNANTSDMLQTIPYGKNWPVCYIIENGNEAYVGETVDASVRASQHWQNDDRRRLTEISIISDDTFNKSVILDLESFLIKHMSADSRFTLQNGNAGLQLHNYFNQDIYRKRFQDIWEQLIVRGLAVNKTETIENSDIFKYSPYNALSSDQFAAVIDIIRDLVDAIKGRKPYTGVVQGGPGTGKTILAIYLMKLLSDKTPEILGSDQETDLQTAQLMETLRQIPSNFRIGFVVPQISLRKTMENVFKFVGGLKASMIKSANTVVSDKADFDLLIVDEAHRLKQRRGLSRFDLFDRKCEKLGLPTTATQIDWIQKKSKYQVFFYDRMQTVLPQDVNRSDFEKLLSQPDVKSYKLITQFRCSAGDKYIEYIQRIMSDNSPEFKRFAPYEFKSFEHLDDMITEIKNLDKKYGLCRVVAGFAWAWASKEDKSQFDICIEDHWYRWNTVDSDWVNSPNSLNEIGCIHTIQGYDLNYTGVIFGREIDYDWNKKQIVIYKQYYKQPHGKDGTKDNPEMLVEHIENIYKTLMTRGIRGTYVYACNPGMRKYLSQFTCAI